MEYGGYINTNRRNGGVGLGASLLGPWHLGGPFSIAVLNREAMFFGLRKGITDERERLSSADQIFSHPLPFSVLSRWGFLLADSLFLAIALFGGKRSENLASASLSRGARLWRAWG